MQLNTQLHQQSRCRFPLDKGDAGWELVRPTRRRITFCPAGHRPHLSEYEARIGHRSSTQKQDCESVNTDDLVSTAISFLSLPCR